MAQISLSGNPSRVSPDLPIDPGETDIVSEAVQLLQQARQRGQADGLPYAGSLTPQEAWSLFEQGAVVLIDVRTPEELRYVGRVPGVSNVPWQIGSSLSTNPRFLRELESKAGSKNEPLVLLCRSGKRSHAAAAAATKAGFGQVYNVTEGFEGDLDEHQQRGALGGWRHWHLPWIQD
ncbi:rhodanese-like domain-containing protein [Paludibacterium sp.]|uniref:rhodanese-like domain-containing protein n=1 Tax=Paludibacterium sp. TaxID=1917523 RepID=UPI0025E50EB3|nr:rhodanese-like domain-containing protein [Paludibacterium sp.]MBV8648676.1 rhodanese-like domain-containing protein [Paludibacterium sp.]